LVEKIKTTLGEAIRWSREQKGINRTKLARITGISPNTLVKYEKAQLPDGKIPSLPKMVTLARILELDPRMIFELLDDPQKQIENKFSFSTHFEKITDQLSEMVSSVRDVEQRIRELENTDKQNGPDQNDPDRPEKSTNETEAVEAASTRKPGGD